MKFNNQLRSCCPAGILQQRQTVATGNRPLRQWKRQQAAGGKQVWSDDEEGGGLHNSEGRFHRETWMRRERFSESCSLPGVFLHWLCVWSTFVSSLAVDSRRHLTYKHLLKSKEVLLRSDYCICGTRWCSGSFFFFIGLNRFSFRSHESSKLN